MVGRKDGSLRPGIDYRGLHNITSKNKSMRGNRLPLIDFVFSFSAPLGHFHLTWALAVFQAFVNDVLRDMRYCIILIYLDHLLIFSWTLKEHIQHLRMGLQRLIEKKQFLKSEKCLFLWTSPRFSEHLICYPTVFLVVHIVPGH